MIHWIGKSEYWAPIPTDDLPRYVMPLVEESVLDVATMIINRPPSIKRLSLNAALNCTSRLALRVALASTGFNPEWRPFEWMPGVVKAPASCMNSGVRFLPASEYTDRLTEVAPELARFGVVESFVEGEALEQDGWIIDGRIGFFRTLRQQWSEANDRILSYEPVERAGIYDVTERAVRALGINNAPFCSEWRRYDSEHKTEWKVLDIGARLGEDKGLSDLLCDEYPLDVIEKAAKSQSPKAAG